MSKSDDIKSGKKFSNFTISALLLLSIAILFFVVDNPSNKDKKYIANEGFIFGTTYHITYSNKDNVDLSSHIANALTAVDNSLSMFNPQSTIASVNRGEDICLDSLFLRVLTRGFLISTLSEGCFDMTVAPLVDLWGFGLSKRECVDSLQVDSIMQFVGWNKLELVDEKIVKTSPNIRLDASAIAKGFACDVVADTLRAYGCTDWCVEIGGEVAIEGTNPKGDIWRIGINTPVEDSLSVVSEINDVVLIKCGGMATSGNYRNFYEAGGVKISHTINPLTGYPVEHSLLSATVLAKDCMTADAWATACMVGGLDRAKVWIEKYNLEGYLIYQENGVMKVWYSNSFPLKK